MMNFFQHNTKASVRDLRHGSVVMVNGHEMVVSKVLGMDDNVARNSIGLELAEKHGNQEFFMELGLDPGSRPFLCKISRNPDKPDMWVRERKLVVTSFCVASL